MDYQAKDLEERTITYVTLHKIDKRIYEVEYDKYVCAHTHIEKEDCGLYRSIEDAEIIRDLVEEELYQKGFEKGTWDGQYTLPRTDIEACINIASFEVNKSDITSDEEGRIYHNGMEIE